MGLTTVVRGALLAVGLDRAGRAALDETLVAKPRGRAGYPEPPSFRICGRPTLFGDEVGGALLLPRYSDVALRLMQEAPPRKPAYAVGVDGFEWNAAERLRDGQLAGVERVMAELTASGGCIINGDTGSGKTVVALHVLSRLRPRRALVLVDQVDIARQWADRARRFLPGVALKFFGDGASARALRRSYPNGPETRGELVIGTAQTLARQAVELLPPERYDALVCDEVHVFAAPTFAHALYTIDFGYAIGLTATEDRKDALQWVFKAFLGRTSIPFAGETADPRVTAVNVPDMPEVRENDHYAVHCSRLHVDTTVAKCAVCPHRGQFPACGGRLPVNDEGNIEWGNKLDRAGLLDAILTPTYANWLHERVVAPLFRAGRRAFVFSERIAFLRLLHDRGYAEFGADAVGVYVGERSASERAARAEALKRQITYCSYGVARKALDVPDKDAAVFGTPISDGRQAAGRIRRVHAGKREPLLVVPVLPYGFAKRAWFRLLRQFKEARWIVERA